jgi:hypothetical protein
MMRQSRGRLRVPALMLILGTGLAAAETVGRGWHNAISIEVIAVVAAAGFYLVGGRDNDMGALYGSHSDERQHMVRLRAQALTAQAMTLGCLVGFMVDIARRAPTWPFVVIVGVAVVSFLAGMAIFRDRDPFPGSLDDGRSPANPGPAGSRPGRH